MFIVFLARIFLHEPFDLIDLIIVICAVIGIFSISGPHYINAIINPESLGKWSKDDILGVSLASLACVAISCGNCSIRKISKTPAPVVVVWFSFFSMTCAIILVPIVDKYVAPESATQWIYIFFVGFFGLLTQIFVTLAFQLEHAAPISVMESFNVAFSFLVQYYVFNETIQLTSIIGAVILFCSVFAIGLKKFISKRNIHPDQLDNVNQINGLNFPNQNFTTTNSLVIVTSQSQIHNYIPSQVTNYLPAQIINNNNNNNYQEQQGVGEQLERVGESAPPSYENVVMKKTTD